MDSLKNPPGGVYRSVKELILAGTYRAGNKLVHEEVAATLGVSRTPVREAFERLLQEGYLTHIPRRGYFVSEISLEEGRNLYGIREALELYALRSTFRERRGGVDVGPLLEINERYSKAIVDRVAKTRLKVDAEFHLALASQAGNRHLVEILASGFDRIALKMRTETYEPRLGEEALREHEALIETFVEGDVDRAVEQLRRHIVAARTRLLEQMELWT